MALTKIEPIAIVGIGCRFPQADNPQTFWQLLSSGNHAITPVPAERWAMETYYDPTPGAAGKMSSAQGGFLTDVDRFDAAFFGIRDEEAQHIDPQQRLFLEVAWEALEHASIAPLNLGGSATGVFTGLCTIDYHRLLYRDIHCIGPHSGTGTTMSITANRLSYLLDLRGPSMAVDAACSSSLVAVHLACQSLRSQESNLCIAGGINLILSPDSMISSSQTGLLSAQGACRPFDQKADGYVRGEGCGVVVLKRLGDAQADGDNILAVIRGSAINQDGLSNSLTAPNGLAQQALIQRALETGGVTPQDIDYVEAHAVGTPLGDAIEFKALKKALMAKRDRPCYVGSLKPNIGHLEAASGIAALIKVVLALHHESIPPQLNFEQANAYVDLDGAPFEIAVDGQGWPRTSRPRLAGVSTFGFGGTNAHLVIAEAPAEQTAEDTTHRTKGEMPPGLQQLGTSECDRTHHLITLTAKSPSALRHLAARYSEFLSDQALMTGLRTAEEKLATHALADQQSQLSNVCFTANTGRSHFSHRLCLISESSNQLQQQLAQFSEGEETLLASQFITGKVKGRKRLKIVFHFPEPTVGTLRLGKTLYQTQPIFRQAFDSCAQLSPQPILLDFGFEASAEAIALSATAKASEFVIAYAFATMWQRWGVRPTAVTGEGIGDYAAACVAGLLNIEQVMPLLSGLIAAPMENMDSLAYQVPRVPVSFSRESPLRQQAVSKLTGDSGDNPKVQAALQKHLPPFESALFERGGYDWVLPMGATRGLDNAMLAPVGQTVKIQQFQDELNVWPQLLTQLGRLFVQGVAVDWAEFDRGYERSRLPLPTYPFERSSHWFGLSKPAEKAPQPAEQPAGSSPLKPVLATLNAPLASRYSQAANNN